MELKLRKYQEDIVKKALKKNTLVVLPTGLGKTIIAIAIAKERLKYGRILMMAPTKPLVEQHKKTFEEWDLIGEIITGKVRKEKRKIIWDRADIIFATPQTVENDLKENIVPLEEFSLLIFDEAHRAVGNYSYVKIAKEYVKRGKNKLIIGLTASPGNSKEKIMEVCKNLFIDNIEFRTENHPDVKPYIKEKIINTVIVEMPEEIKYLRRFLRDIIRDRLEVLKEVGLIETSATTKVKLSDLINLQGKTQNPKLEVYLAQAIKLYHLLRLLESYGIEEARRYVEKIEEDNKKSSKLLVLDEKFRRFKEMLHKINVENPKIKKLLEILKKEKPERAIIFVNFKENAKILENILKKSGFKASWFVGQREGMSQKKQLEILEKFKIGEINVLISTSIGEEGLHIPNVDIVIFFEPVPSALRSIQRKGRTGRTKIGKVYILVVKGSIDSGYYFISKKRERNMIRNLIAAKKELMRKSQRSIIDYLKR